MKYFKIKTGYSDDQYVSIDETELETALYIFLTDGKAIFNEGVVRGKDITGIKEDFHKAMNWNPEHKLGPDDYNELKQKGVSQEYAGLLESTKNKVRYLIETKQEHLIGKNIALPELDAPQNTSLREQIDTLAASKRIS